MLILNKVIVRKYGLKLKLYSTTYDYNHSINLNISDLKTFLLKSNININKEVKIVIYGI